MKAPETEGTTKQLHPLFPAYLKAIAPFFSRDETKPILTAVHIDGEVIVATDSYRLVKITYKGMDAADFPTIAGERPKAAVLHGVNIDGATFVRALNAIQTGKRRNTLPILNGVAVMKETPDTVSFGVTDLEQATTFTIRKIKGTAFPNYEHLFPDSAPRGVVTLQVRYLADMAKAIREFGAESVTIEVRSRLAPVVFRAKNNVNGVFEAIQMPVREADVAPSAGDQVDLATAGLKKALTAPIGPEGFKTKTEKKAAIAAARTSLDALLTGGDAL